MAHRCLLASVLVALLVCGESYRAVLSTRLLTTSSRRPHCLTPLTLKSDDAADTSTKSESGLGMKLAEATGFSVETEGELTPAEDAALIDRINSEVLAESGVPLDQLINPSKVVNAERDLVILKRQLAVAADPAERGAIEAKMAKKTQVLAQEKRAVMRGWLKNLFVGQSVIAGAVSLALVYHVIPAPLPVQVLGFWMWWLFIVPSLRARKPLAQEKEALNWAFLATPLVSILMPFATKDVAVIWWGNALATAGCYAFAYLKPPPAEGDGGGDGGEGEGEGMEDVQQGMAPLLIRAWKALDYGSGQERGARR